VAITNIIIKILKAIFRGDETQPNFYIRFLHIRFDGGFQIVPPWIVPAALSFVVCTYSPAVRCCPVAVAGCLGG
jgi:hypothetical protein